MDEDMNNGLARHVAAALFKVHAGASSQYALRLGTASSEAVKEYGAFLKQNWEGFGKGAIGEDTWARVCLPNAMGGLWGAVGREEGSPSYVGGMGGSITGYKPSSATGRRTAK